MQLVVPRAVRAAVRMLTMTCRMVFQVSFFMVLMVYGLRNKIFTKSPTNLFYCFSFPFQCAAILCAIFRDFCSMTKVLRFHWAVASTLILGLGRQRVDVDELSLLQELAAGDVLLLFLFRQEADVQSLQARVHAELVSTLGAALRVLDGAVERAQALNLHSLRLQQHLNQAAAELLQHAVHHVGGVDGAVLGDVLCQLARVQGLDGLAVREPHAIDPGGRVRVLLQLIKNFAIISRVFAGFCLRECFRILQWY